VLASPQTLVSFPLNLDDDLVWNNKNGLSENTSFANAPYTITSLASNLSYFISVGVYNAGQSRYDFGTNSSNVVNYYNLTHHASLSAYASLSTVARASVYVLLTPLYYVNMHEMMYTYTGGNAHYEFQITPIYSFDNGSSWEKNAKSETFKTSSSGGSVLLDDIDNPITPRVAYGFLFEHMDASISSNFYMFNPSITMTYEKMSASDQAQALIHIIDALSPCASEENQMIQLTLHMQSELLEMYEHMNQAGKDMFQTALLSDHSSAFARYQYLVTAFI
jgi:hypothetical protein